MSRSLTQESIVLGETNPENVSDVAEFAPPSSIFDATFSITNLGSTRVPFARLSIFWPLIAPVGCGDLSTDEDCRFYLYPIRTDDGVSYDGMRYSYVYSYWIFYAMLIYSETWTQNFVILKI